MRKSLNRGKLNERVMAGGLREFAAELRLIDIADLIAYIRADKFGHIESLVSSAAEVVMKPGVVRFASSAQVDVDWETLPKVSLDMEFMNRDVRVYFTLILESTMASVHINYMTIADGRLDGGGEDGTRRLIEAMEDAREFTDGDDGSMPTPSDKSLRN